VPLFVYFASTAPTNPCHRTSRLEIRLESTHILPLREERIPMSIRKSFAVAVLLAVVVLFASAVRSEAQIKIQFFSTFAKNNVVPTDCLKERDIVLPVILSYDHPANWTWIIACDEPAWKRVEVHMGQMNSVHGQTLASTDLETRMTYVRGVAVIQPFTAAFEAQPEHTIAHELSHIMLDSHDEAKVEKRTRLVMQQQHAVLLAQTQQAKPSLPPQ
jgi:hypothetical protein